jgi:hypothetical protein
MATLKSFAALIAWTVIGFSTPVRAEMRVWTDTSGRRIEAEMTGLDVSAKAVKLRLKNGRDAAVPITRLSPEDVTYAAAQWQLIKAGQPSAPANSLRSLPSRYVSRCTEGSRLAAVAQHGGGPECEEAVKKSLQWLQQQQNLDGSWSNRNRAGYTALALQCFTGHGEGPASSDYSGTVLKAVEYLMKAAANNPHGVLSDDFKSNAGAYEHAIAATALGEVLILAWSEDQVPPGLEAAFTKAISVIVDWQGSQGLWDYYTIPMAEGGRPTARNDLSVTNWQMQALTVAKEAQIVVPGMDACITTAVAALNRTQTKDGGFGATNQDQHYNQWHMTGGSVLGLQMMAGGGQTAAISKGIQFMRNHYKAEPPKWDRSCNLYTWASATPAFFNAGGEDWRWFRDQLLTELLNAQEQDGSFKAGRPNWPAGTAADPVYRQALCTLQLEVFYRYGK